VLAVVLIFAGCAACCCCCCSEELGLWESLRESGFQLTFKDDFPGGATEMNTFKAIVVTPRVDPTVFVFSQFLNYNGALLILNPKWLEDVNLGLVNLGCWVSDATPVQEIIEPEHPIFQGYRAGEQGPKRHGYGLISGATEMQPVLAGAPSRQAALLDVSDFNLTAFRVYDNPPLQQCALQHGGRILARQLDSHARAQPALALVDDYSAKNG
jgi:hypothetical protein